VVCSGDYGGVNYEYVEPRRYKLKGGATSKTARGDKADCRLTLRVGMIMPKKKKYNSLSPHLFVLPHLLPWYWNTNQV
jgi:hypothetical protein